MRQKFLRCAASLLMGTGLLMTASGSAWAGANESLSPDNLVLSRSVYAGTATTVVAGQTLPPGCVPGTVNLPVIGGGTTTVKIPNNSSSGCNTANSNGTYPTVFNNDQQDASFGVTSPVFLDQMTPGGLFIDTFPINPSQIVTSFSSKSELAVNRSLDGKSITFAGYVGGPGFPNASNQLDISNSNTPGVVDPTNPVVSQYYRAVAEVDSNGDVQITKGNAYSGNNGRAAIKANASSYYMVGNDNNGGLSKTQLTDTQVGGNLVNSTGVEFLVPGQAPGIPNKIGDFEITQVGYITADKAGKDNNFRGLTIFDNTLYVTKGSGSNGINTVYQVGDAGTLPTSSNAPGGNLLNVPITIVPGFPTTLASGVALNGSMNNPVAFPFGVWFANAATLYVCDEGDGTLVSPPVNGNVADAATLATAGVQKWLFNSTTKTWQRAYVLQNGLNLGIPYGVSNGPNGETYPTSLNPAPDGCRNITGRVNTDGTVNIWAVTSTVSANGDQGADPNQLVFITDNLTNTETAGASHEQFAVLRTAGYGEVLRGVSFAPGTIAPGPTSDTGCNGVYNGTFPGNLTISTGQKCVFVGGTINGNVQLNGGSLTLTNAAVGGNVQISGDGTFSIGPSTTIHGNLQIQNIPVNAAGNQVCDTRIAGNVEFHNNETAVEIGPASPVCTGNTISGNLQVQNNTAATTIVGNAVDGNLDDHDNSAPTVVLDNTVANKLQCNNNSSITGGGNTARQKQGQCSSF